MSEAAMRQGLVVGIDEIARRATSETRVLLAEGMSRGRMVYSVFQAPDTPRMLAYALHPETFHRACTRAYEWWGVGHDDYFGGAPIAVVESFGGEYTIPVSKPSITFSDEPYPFEGKGYYDWRITLR